jgi:drug/metabolite transporter (DMT)-like permease
MRPRSASLLGICAVSYGFTQIVEKTGIDRGISPSLFSLSSTLCGLLTVGIVWMALRRRKGLAFRSAHLPDYALIGGLTAGLATLLSVGALLFTTATSKSVTQGGYTAMTLIVAHLWLRERLPRLYYPAVLIILLGITLLTSKGFTRLPNAGDVLLLCTIPIIGFGNVYAKRTLDRGGDPYSLSLGRYLFGFLFLLCALPLFGLSSMHVLGAQWHLPLLAGFLSGVRTLTFYMSVEAESPTLAATVLAAGPAVTALADVLLLGSRFTPLQVVGLVLAIGGAIGVTRLRARYVPSV